MNLNNKPPISQTDKLCLAALAGILAAVTIGYELTDGAALRAANEDNSQIEVVAATPPIDYTPLVEAIEAAIKSAQEDPYDETIPLDRELQEVLWEACEINRVPLCDALGVIQVESGFDPEAVNGVCYGLMQLNTKYFPADLPPEDNIRAGVAWLGELLERYEGDTQAALRAYNKGWDDGGRVYARAVLDASEKWGRG